MLLAVAVFRCAHLWTAPNIYIWDIDEVEFVVDSCFNCNNGRKVCSNFSLSICFCFFFISWLLLVVVVLIFESDGNLPTFHLSCGATDTHKHIRTKTVCLLFLSVLIFWSSHRLHCILRLANWPSRRRIFGSLQMLLHATPCSHCAQAMVCSTVITLLLTVGRQSFIFLSFVGRNCFICCVVLCSVCRSAVEYQRRMPSCSW